MGSINEHLNAEALDELKEVMEDDFSILVETFINDSDSRVEALSELVKGEDGEAIRREAHSLKGSSSNIGAITLTSLCEYLEFKGRDHQLAEAIDMFIKVKKEYTVVKQLLTEHYL